MGVTAENVAERYSVTREEQDAYALESQRRAQEAQQSGAVAAEITPVTISGRRGETVVDTDEHPRAVTLSTLAAMRTVFRREGGAIAWGHPIGATGAIISARTIENLRVTDRELGLATMCIGGGQAVASLWRAL